MSFSLTRYLVADTARHATQLRLASFNRAAIPIDLRPITLAWHATCEFGDPVRMAHLPGFSFWDTDHHRIVLNPTHPQPIQRFTWAHELGHILLGHLYLPLQHWHARHWSTDIMEIEANAAAAECLIPHDWLLQQLQPYGLPPWPQASQARQIMRDLAPQWAAILHVSPNVVRYSLIDLAGIPPGTPAPVDPPDPLPNRRMTRPTSGEDSAQA